VVVNHQVAYVSSLEAQSGILVSADAAYLISFSVIMLNTGTARDRRDDASLNHTRQTSNKIIPFT
jgi:hypothetical protein